MDDLCRLCADQLMQIKANVFSPENSHILSTIMECIPITIKEDDRFPKNICSNCLATLNNLNELRSKSLKAVEIFKEAVISASEYEDSDTVEKLPLVKVKEEIFTVEVYEEPEAKYNITVCEDRNAPNFPEVKEEVFSDMEANEEPETNYIIDDPENSETPGFECGRCHKIFERKKGLTNHSRWCLQSMDGSFSCHICGKSFGWKSQLIRHSRAHSGEKPYRCNECGKFFAQTNYLQKHLMRHSGDRPFRCEECGKCFTFKSNLNEHLESHSSDKSFQCQECGKIFTQKYYLKLHQRVHTGEKPFQCLQCGKNYSQKHNLNKHLLIHSGEGSNNASL